MIQNSSVIVNMNIGVWTARKMDKKAAAQVDATNNTKVKAGNYNKKLLPCAKALENLQSVASNIRLWHYENTLPWDDNGGRLLPMANFFDYKALLAGFQTQFNDACDAFYNEYSTLVSAAAFTLSGLFDANDYPHIDDIRRKNYFRVTFSPVPASGDFRVDIGEQGKRELGEELERVHQERLNGAMKDMWERLHECLQHMSDKLAGEEKQIFRDSLVTNAIELCGVLTKLNITNDPKLESARKELEKAMVGLNANDLRKDNALRLDTKARVDAILSMM
jgi:hypothetical protein